MECKDDAGTGGSKGDGSDELFLGWASDELPSWTKAKRGEARSLNEIILPAQLGIGLLTSRAELERAPS